MPQKQSVYLEVAERIAGDIRDGLFQPGERLHSRKELCERFSISGPTAVRVQGELVKMGLIRKVRGSGVFVNYLKEFPDFSSKQNTANLKKVVLFMKPSGGGWGAWPEAIQAGIQLRATQLRLDLRIEIIPAGSMGADVFMAYPAKADEGYIAISTGAEIHFAAGALLFSPSVKSVLIDYITPGSSCVLTDNFDGVGKLVAHAVSRGRRNFIFASNFTGTGFTATGALNASERELAFRQEARLRGLRSAVIDSGRFEDIVDAVKGESASTAVLFPQDDAALRCRRILQTAGIAPMPLVMGFDDFAPSEKGLERMTTIRVDRAAMGATAVDTLLACGGAGRSEKIIRVPGELIVRD